MKQDVDFDVISDEIKRQYELGMKIDDSHDTKIGIILGFTIMVLAQIILNKDFIEFILLNKYSSIMFFIGISIMCFSAYSGIRAYFLRKYAVGAEISDLIKQYRNGEVRDYKKVITREIYDSHTHNSKNSQNKAQYIKNMFISFFIGFLVILLSRVAYMVM